MKLSVSDSKVWMAVLAGLLLFIPIALIPVAWKTDFELADGIGAALSIGMAVACWRPTIRTLRLSFREVTEAGKIFLVFFFLLAVALFFVFSGLWMWRIFDQPQRLAESYLWLFSRWVVICAMFGMVTLHWSADGVVGDNAYRKTAVVVAIGTALALITITFGLPFLKP